MKSYRIRPIIKAGVLLMAVIVLLGAGSAGAQSGGGYEQIRSTTASSGLISAGGYTLSGTAGQADAQGSGGGGYRLAGGFWSGGRFLGVIRVYLPFMPNVIIVYPGASGADGVVSDDYP